MTATLKQQLDAGILSPENAALEFERQTGVSATHPVVITALSTHNRALTERVAAHAHAKWHREGREWLDRHGGTDGRVQLGCEMLKGAMDAEVGSFRRYLAEPASDSVFPGDIKNTSAGLPEYECRVFLWVLVALWPASPAVLTVNAVALLAVAIGIDSPTPSAVTAPKNKKLRERWMGYLKEIAAAEGHFKLPTIHDPVVAGLSEAALRQFIAEARDWRP